LYTENLTTQTEPIVENNCQEGYGRLPGDCGSLAFPYVPTQLNSNKRYANRQALQNGTLFPGLNLPFKYGAEKPGKLSESALHELMAMDFAIDELGLYLTTHSEDKDALALYLETGFAVHKKMLEMGWVEKSSLCDWLSAIRRNRINIVPRLLFGGEILAGVTRRATNATALVDAQRMIGMDGDGIHAA